MTSCVAFDFHCRARVDLQDYDQGKYLTEQLQDLQARRGQTLSMQAASAAAAAAFGTDGRASPSLGQARPGSPPRSPTATGRGSPSRVEAVPAVGEGAGSPRRQGSPPHPAVAARTSGTAAYAAALAAVDPAMADKQHEQQLLRATIALSAVLTADHTGLLGPASINRGVGATACSRWFAPDGSFEWLPCEVLLVSDNGTLFQIKWRHTGRPQWRACCVQCASEP